MRIDVYHHLDHATQDTVLRALSNLITQGARIMTKLDDLKSTLADASTKIDEIAASEEAQSKDIAEIATDMDAVLSQLANGDPDSPQVAEALESARGLLGRLSGAADASAAQATALRSVADKFTAPEPPAA